MKTLYSKNLWREYPFRWSEFFAWKQYSITRANDDTAGGKPQPLVADNGHKNKESNHL